MIVSNPPYISTKEFSNLSRGVKEFEPKEALLAGEDGLNVIRRIVKEAEPYLAEDGVLMIEIAYDQSEQVLALFENSDYLTNIEAAKDNLGHKRVIKGKK